MGQMSNAVTVKVPARLHLGFLDLNGDAGRSFGSIGLPLSGPETIVRLSRSVETIVVGGERARAAEHLRTLCGHLKIGTRHRLTIESAIPAHVGLGSGTQIALAVAAALRTLHGLPLDVDGDAALLGRGARSGVGIASFLDGGVIIDAGKGDDTAPPTVVARIPFPDEWRIVLILDKGSAGLHGPEEIEAFRRLPRFPASGAGDICRQVLMAAMPALIERDLTAFSAAITKIQLRLGNHFAPVQGGVFTSKRVEATIERLAANGAVGMGQSSWGPTGFVFAPSEGSAREMVDAVKGKAPDGIELKIVRGRNTGAEISSTAFGLVGS
jgi:beta-ribofuranosylaminobenzene 5'-phosphate synthase